jgi:hypothetical protein
MVGAAAMNGNQSPTPVLTDNRQAPEEQRPMPATRLTRRLRGRLRPEAVLGRSIGDRCRPDHRSPCACGPVVPPRRRRPAPRRRLHRPGDGEQHAAPVDELAAARMLQGAISPSPRTLADVEWRPVRLAFRLRAATARSNTPRPLAAWIAT